MLSPASRSWSSRIPTVLRKLVDLAYDLSWTYRRATRDVFKRVDPLLYQAKRGNPVALLQTVDAERLTSLAQDHAFMADMEHCWETAMDPAQAPPGTSGPGLCVAYFCAEFGLSEVLPFYSGGLGILAGDHFKASRDIGVPSVAIGLAYRHGYFRQAIEADGTQRSSSEMNAFDELPMERVLGPDGEALQVHVRMAGRTVRAAIWQLRLGMNRLYLLDTDVEGNTAQDRAITGTLYGGDTKMRLAQEIVLGMGGLRALRAMGIRPTVFHMNEGHAAFMALERIATSVAAGMSFQQAFSDCSGANVFTTHTPVPAGFDVFSPEEMNTFLPDYHERLGLSRAAFLALGGPITSEEGPGGFNMAFLAMRSASRINGVSRLHGHVARSMWQGFWPHRPLDDVPIGHVTNGVHVETWRAPAWSQIDAAAPDDGAIWRERNASRLRLVRFVREAVKRRHTRLGSPATDWIDGLFDPEVLTIGFARRFATYKRATLLLREEDRLRALLVHPTRPIQFVFAGKAHPRDMGGQEIIAEIVRFSEDSTVRGRFQFLEGYDIALAQQLVQGVDVWLNTPRRPKEASGTSGMKVVLNGGLNLSILDGWWDEAYDGRNGWAIGSGEVTADPETADAREANQLLTLLESEVVPAFYERNDAGIPEAWVARIRRSLTSLGPRFSAARMVGDYVDQLYGPAHEASQGR